MREVTKINKALPEDRKLSVRERRDYISKRVYPKYKKLSPSQLKKSQRQLRDYLIRSMKRLPKKEGCDVLAIPAKTYQDIVYFDVENFLTNILPPCVYVKINAGPFGSTNIFNTRDYDYYKSGLSDITNEINTHARKKNKSFYNDHIFNGTTLLRPRKPNNGDPENYYIELILSDVGLSVPKPTELPQEVKKKVKKSKQGIERYIRERIKQTRAIKSRFKPLRSKVQKSIQLMKEVSKNEFLKKTDRENAKKQIYEGILKKIEKWRGDDRISERAYRDFIRQIKDAYKGKRKGRKK